MRRSTRRRGSDSRPALQVQLTASDVAVTFEVEDDGQGFDPSATRRGAGLTNMRDRLDALGGSFEIDSKPQSGTRVRARLPNPVPEVLA